MKTNIKIVLNTQRPDSKGNYPVRIRTTIKGHVSYYPTGMMCTKGQLVDGVIVGHHLKTLMNVKLRKQISQIETDLLEQSITGENVTRLKKNTDLKFSEYAKKKINQWKGSQAKSTIIHKNSYLTKVNTFNPNLKLNSINKDVLIKFEDYCRDKGNKPNTIWGASKFIKTVLNAAFIDGVISSNRIKGFKGVRYSDPLRTILNEDEIKLIEDFADNKLNPLKLRDVASWFVFGCYTGLRFSDMARFKGFVNDRVLLKTAKTGEVVSIVATDKIKVAYARIEKSMISNQKFNDFLKTICASLGIEKRVTAHLSRHSFAVAYLQRGGRIEVLSKILGHGAIKTTSIYAKLSNLTIDAEMLEVWK